MLLKLLLIVFSFLWQSRIPGPGGALGTPPPPFSVCFDFRNTSGYVTDPSGCTGAQGELYNASTPHIYTMNGTGQTVGAGVVSPTPPFSCAAATFPSLDIFVQDPRLSGSGYQGPGICGVFRVDLPSTGTYKIHLAVGQENNARTGNLVYIYDNLTLKATIGPTNTGANSFMDASGAALTYSSWISAGGAQISLTFATTTFYLKLGDSSTTDYDCLANLTISQ
jgi:hypothetical protein